MVVTKRKHLDVARFFVEEPFRSKRTGRNSGIPGQSRGQHGAKLGRQYQAVLERYSAQSEQREAPITPDMGIYVEVIGVPGIKLPLDSLDNRDFKLCTCKHSGVQEVALIFIPEERRGTFHKKLEQYLDPSKDGKHNDEGVSFPRNHTLIDSIEEIRLANLESFWTDPAELFPTNREVQVWWELWLKKTVDGDANEIAQTLANRINGRIGNTSITFFNSTVVLLKASVNELEKAPELISNLEELRKAKDTPVPIIDSSPTEQQEWLKSIADRVQFTEGIKTSVSILDTGVNFNHSLLQKVCRDEFSVTWEPSWPKYDEYVPAAPFNDHGSLQAGLAAFGDLMNVALNNQPITLSHVIESARILPPLGGNDPMLYGAITVGTAYKLEIDRPDMNRIYSLAVTSDYERESGRPSSWSAEIDQFCSGMEDGKRRLFVISAGNNLNISTALDYWEQVGLAQIEDPAQAWNAITVGAYTDMTTNDDPIFQGWSPFALAGDVAPSSRSSVNWSWRRHAPIKPDVVAEGGNRLLSPDRTEVSNEDVVALLTTSGKTVGQTFERGSDTSAACALISRVAAQLTAEYPELWPETVRGLIVHSAEWTPRMLERFGLLSGQHSPKIAKETLLRTVGYGVPNIDKARFSANHALTLIAEGELQPFIKPQGASSSTDPKLNQMKLYQLPWPLAELQNLPPELEVKLRVTLSYFIEPNPGRRGYRTRYSYQSHGLRFETIRPGQSLDNFRAYINGLAKNEEYEGPEGDTEGWFLGAQLRTRGSVHSDIWSGSAQDLADIHTIAVFPVGGWWKYKTAEERWQNRVRFSVLVSIEVPDQNIDIYSVIDNKIKIAIENQTQIEIGT
ncbi:S8 family peptidase [Pseudoalteromonas sp. MMG005]|nr:S8 family peptidase [Pseudoalteromonas sp. MMG005]